MEAEPDHSTSQGTASRRKRLFIKGSGLLAIWFCPLHLGAVVNPESKQASAPVVVKCLVVEAHSDARGDLELHTASCEVLEVSRKPSGMTIGKEIRIAYAVNPGLIQKQMDEIEEKVKENPGWAGLGPDLPPRDLVQGQIVVAYLSLPQVSESGEVFSPAAGLESFVQVDHDADNPLPRASAPQVGRFKLAAASCCLPIECLSPYFVR